MNTHTKANQAPEWTKPEIESGYLFQSKRGLCVELSKEIQKNNA